jgi:lysophospholipase L1-like esterase
MLTPTLVPPPAAAAPATGADWVLNLRPGAVIAAEGDSLTYGQDASQPGRGGINGAATPRSRSPYPETLQAELGGVRVVNRGYPGDRSLDGFRRWSQAPAGDVTLIMYGTNDALSPGSWLAITQYRRVLATLIQKRQQAGSTVIVLLPPPTESLAANAELEPYRQAAAQIAQDLGARALDAGQALRGVAQPYADPVHLRPQAYRAIALLVAAHLRVAPTAPASSVFAQAPAPGAARKARMVGNGPGPRPVGHVWMRLRFHRRAIGSRFLLYGGDVRCPPMPTATIRIWPRCSTRRTWAIRTPICSPSRRCPTFWT